MKEVGPGVNLGGTFYPQISQMPQIGVKGVGRGGRRIGLQQGFSSLIAPITRMPVCQSCWGAGVIRLPDYHNCRDCSSLCRSTAFWKIYQGRYLLLYSNDAIYQHFRKVEYDCGCHRPNPVENALPPTGCPSMTENTRSGDDLRMVLFIQDQGIAGKESCSLLFRRGEGNLPAQVVLAEQTHTVGSQSSTFAPGRE